MAAVLILLAAARLLTAAGILGGYDDLSGYFMLQVNPASDATPEQTQETMIFGMQRLALNTNHTFRFATLLGNWSRSGDRLSLEPTSVPPADTFFTKTTMGSALSILLKPSEFTVSADEKTLTIVNPTNGPVVFRKTGDSLR